MDIKLVMNSYKKSIDIELENFFDSRIDRARNVSASAREAMEILKEFNLRGGKRIRPMLTIFSYKGFGGTSKEIIKAALAVELMESFLLIHDDVMDEDELRRGKPTVHKLFASKFKGPKAGSFGESMAIVVGDIASVLGSEALLAADFPGPRKLAAIEKFNRVIINTCFGQMLDLQSHLTDVDRIEDVLQIHTLKTAIYTIDGPIQIGAILAGAKSTERRKLELVSIPLGRAFQIKDDILGMFGTKEKIGKPVGNDFRQGKRTLLIVKALESANVKDRAFLERNLGNKSANASVIERVNKIIVQTGSLEFSEMLLRENIEKAKIGLQKLKLKPEGKEFLEAIADFIAQREK